MLVAAGLALAPARAAAAPDETPAAGETPRESADALSEQAVQKFEAGEYDAAVALFEEAHAVDPQPNYLFNIGRVYEEKGDLEKAVEFYQRFVGESGVDLDSRQIATDRLKVLRAALEQLRTEKQPEGKEPTEPQPAVKPADGEREPVDAPRDDGRTRKLRIAGYSLMGIGAAGLIAGGALGGVALGTTRDADGEMFVDEQARLRRRARTQAGAADGLFITGGVLAVVGLVLVLSTFGAKAGQKRSTAKAGTRAKSRTTWAPAVSPRAIGLGMTHRF